MMHLTYQTEVENRRRLLGLRRAHPRGPAFLRAPHRDVVPPQDPKREQARVKSNQEILRRVERREAQDLFQFFERLSR